MYHLGKKSMKELVGVHPLLAFAVVKAIEITKQDFMVFDGVRSEAEQEKNLARGVSKSKDSYHLYGLAVDLVAWVDGKPSWEDKYYEAIANAMHTVIDEYGLPIEWGYDMWKWDLPHWQIRTINGLSAKAVYDIRKLA